MRTRHTSNDLADLLVCIEVAAAVELEGNMIFDLFLDPTRLCTCKFDSTTISSKPVFNTARKPIKLLQLSTWNSIFNRLNCYRYLPTKYYNVKHCKSSDKVEGWKIIEKPFVFSKSFRFVFTLWGLLKSARPVGRSRLSSHIFQWFDSVLWWFTVGILWSAKASGY